MARTNNGPKLELSPSGRYEIRWTENGRSKRKTTKTKDVFEAEKQLKQFIDKGRTGVLLIDIFEHYEKSESFINASDQRGLADTILILNKGFGCVPYDLLTKEIIQKFINDRLNGVIKPGARPNARPGPVKMTTVKKNITILKAAINYAWRSGFVPHPRSDIFPRITKDGSVYKKEQEDSLYIMKCRRSGYYKIGVSDNPEARELTLQAENPDIVMVGSWPTHAVNEKRIHRYFGFFVKRLGK